ncbi:Choline dehydrogenase, mitochondrial [Folsomia candida]|uniref:Choline dehydrogenase, mitochondrial n=1 Tax=Folsomia candida TaxID=158441 RepID=A0A226EKV8_FOLCA|nr:Choline dehydrogenase, mitochondrial [Folsomia candida]
MVKVSHWPGGRQLGGSSTINGLIYIRGNVQGFNKIAENLGDEKWRLENVLKYYHKIEDYFGYFEDGSHGKGGGMGVEKAYIMPFTSHLLDSGLELGYKIRDPNNGPYTEGFAPMDFYTKGGQRADAFTGTLLKVMKRVNLIVRKFAYVTKVIIVDGQTVGVEYERHGKAFRAFADKEVILCAGTINTPRILMLSGIGPRKDLERLGIKVVADLPVGQNLQDKYGALMGPFIVKDGYSFIRERDITVQVILRWLFTGTGPMAAARTEATHSFLTNFSRALGDTVERDGLDVHTYVISSSTDGRTELDYGKSFNFKQSSLDYFGSARGKDSFLQLVTLARPKGVGYVKLRDRNPRSPMLIDPKYLQNKEDVKILVEGMKFAVKLVEETNAMRKIDAHLMNIPFPGCEKHSFKSDRYYECLARHTTITAYKYSGTAPVGRMGDPEAVVDNRLRVFGVRNLRIVDASVLQLKYTSVNDATMRMLGQFSSDMILDDWNNPDLGQNQYASNLMNFTQNNYV